MNKRFLLVISALAFMFQLNAQTSQLMIKKGNKGLYLDHSVAPKEGLYAIGRLYKVHPKFIAAYNQIDLNTGLEIGQIIQIPLTDTNFTQKAKNGRPVYYIVGEKEGLTKVSGANNKVAVKDLRSWNGLSNDNPPAGTKLIVGYLMATGQASSTVANPPASQPQVTSPEKNTTKTEKPADKQVAKTEPSEVKSVATGQTQVQKPAVKTEPEKEKIAVADVKTASEKSEPVTIKQEAGVAVAEEGYFKKSFDQQVKAAPPSKNATVTSGIFKTSSGWEDAKYYLLIDGVATGTIIKVTNPDNNKAIYAKVLGEMNGIRQNQGLDVRISNAAASTLGVAETDKFVLKVNY